ncbi:MAG: cytochrome c3 family protein, partial [Planctomycetes bacterium]|nr:cytochrome c3 family protein [Planctomycetota bacterium]
ETCEECHWPKKFFGAQLREIVYYTSDEGNTRHEIDMLLKTGGGDASTGKPQGIHYHMALEGSVEYIATDDVLQEIPWVRYTDKTGNSLIYRSDGWPSSDPPPEGQLRRMDCMDCHNRPAHKFRSPVDAVDVFLDTGGIDGNLPYIKREAVAVLSEPYPDTETAKERIGSALSMFYENNYPEIAQTRRVAVNASIDGVRAIYSQTIFPNMKVDWRTYPDNIGHKISPGCFRCHEGKHINQHGDPISHACDICHTFLNPVDPQGGRSVVERGDFIHPVPLKGPHNDLRCDLCHTGGLPPLPTCEGCHPTQAAFRNATLEVFERFGIEADPMADSVDCESCHDLDKPMTVDAIDKMCMDCHDHEGRFKGMLASWKAEAERLMSGIEHDPDSATIDVLRMLRKAGPLHNLEATRAIVSKLAGDTGS